MIDREFDEITRIHLMMRVVEVSVKTESDKNIDMAPSSLGKLSRFCRLDLRLSKEWSTGKVGDPPSVDCRDCRLQK